MKKIFLSILVLTSLNVFSQEKTHIGIYRIDSLHETLNSTTDTTTYKPVGISSTGRKRRLSYWPVGSSGSSTFAGLTDVNLTTPANNDIPVYNGTQWINKTPAQVRTILGAPSLSGTNTFTGANTFDQNITLNNASIFGNAFYVNNTASMSTSGISSNGGVYYVKTGVPYFMNSVGTETQITPLSGSASLDFPSTIAQTSSDLTITVTGAADGDVVSVGVPNSAVFANSNYTAWVSAANTVTVRFNNYDLTTARDPGSATFKVKVFK